MTTNHWLMKSEPGEFGIDDLARRARQIEPWTGVRNYQARNFMREMKAGDLAFFYHSSCEVPGVAGIVRIARAVYDDPTQFDPKSDYYDAAARRDNPRWSCVDVQLERKLRRVITLTELKARGSRLKGMLLLKPGSRLSVTPVDKTHWDFVLSLE